MAANKKAFCSTCGKPNGRVTCEGCSQLFCLNDFNGHQQNLSKQLDEIEVVRDLFRQALNEIIAKPQNHALIEETDAWEKRSIDTIRHAAEEARQTLLQHIAELNTKLEGKLDELTNQLRHSRAENDFFELNLNQWREELNQMKSELARPSNVTIRNDRSSLVAKLTVDISDKTFNICFRRSAIDALRDKALRESYCSSNVTKCADVSSSSSKRAEVTYS